MTIIKVVEPHAILRMGLLQLISNVVPDLKIEGADYANLFASSREQREIDLVLLSISPGEDTNQLIDSAQHAYAPRSIMLLSDQNYLPSSITLPGVVCGYIPKNSDPEILQAAIRLVLAGGNCFPFCKPIGPKLKVTAEKRPDSPNTSGEPAPNKLSLEAHAESELLGLTPRQYEVLVLLAKGYPMKTVGRHLNISVATAKAHTETLYQRLDVHNRNAAVYAAVSRGAKLGWASISEPSETRSGR